MDKENFNEIISRLRLYFKERNSRYSKGIIQTGHNTALRKDIQKLFPKMSEDNFRMAMLYLQQQGIITNNNWCEIYFTEHIYNPKQSILDK